MGEEGEETGVRGGVCADRSDCVVRQTVVGWHQNNDT